MPDPFIGEIRLVSFDRVPAGWMTCDGRQLLIRNYQALAALIGGTYGPITTTSFTLPDLRGRTPVGVDPRNVNYKLGSALGSETITLTSADAPSHTHAMQVSSEAADFAQTTNAWYASVAGSATVPKLYGAAQDLVELDSRTLDKTGSGSPHNNMQPFIALNYIIAYLGVWPSRP